MMINIRSPLMIILFLFLLAVICVSLLVLGLAIFGDLPDLPSPRAPTLSATSVGTPSGMIVPPTLTPTLSQLEKSVQIISSEIISSPTPLKVLPTLIPTKTPAPASAAANNAAPTSTASPPTPTTPNTPTPAPEPIYGQTQSSSLNLRQGPGTGYGSVGAVDQEDQIIILGKNSDGTWLQVKTPDNKEGWVAAQFIDLPVDIAALPIVETLPISGPISLTLRRSSIPGELEPGQAQDYTFFENQLETVFILMFRPDVNVGGTDHIQFVLYENSGGQSKVIGVGSHPGTDRDGNSSTDELIWRGGPLTPGARYYLRLTNTSNQIVEYCLATQDIYEWSCP